MSGGRVCRCPELRLALRRRYWRTLTFRGNYSAFHGYRFTPSDYSSIICLRCGSCWRTKAAYVDDLKIATEAERCAPPTDRSNEF